MTQLITDNKIFPIQLDLQKLQSNSNQFKLDSQFLSQFVGQQPNWNFFSYIIFKRTYARFIGDSNETEEFWQVLQRVYEGLFSILKQHYHTIGLTWDENYFQSIAQDMFQRSWEFKFLPAGRGLWMGGTEFVDKYGSMCLNNCSFVTTQYISTKLSKPFEFLMDALMLGVGVGLDTRGRNQIIIQKPNNTQKHIIDDSRKGWIMALRQLLYAYFCGKELPIFNYEQIRSKGERIKGFGGICSGFEPLKECFDSIQQLLQSRIGQLLTSVDIMDISGYIAKCVVSGNVRRSAILFLVDKNDHEAIQCKSKPNDHRWTFNISVIADQGMDYSQILPYTIKNGEPAFFWLENAQKYSRMGDKPDWKDKNVKGVNPCFAGYEKLLTIDGEKTFKELENREIELITPYNQIVHGKIWKSGTKQTIKLIFGNFDTLTLTPDHVLMTSDGREIYATDTLDERIRIHNEPKNNFDNYWLQLGFIQGDGQLTRLNSDAHRGLEINIGIKDDDIRELFQLPKDGRRNYYVNGYNLDLIKYGFHAEKLPNRELPTNIPKDKYNSFLRGLYSANGCIIHSGNYGRIGFKSTCKKLVEQLKQLLFDLYQINSYITTNKSKIVKFENGEYECKESYDLNIGQIQSIVKFYENIGFIHQYKQKNLEKIIINRSPKVIKIEQDEIQDVYDFLAGDIHWGFVNGFVSHNCAEIALESGDESGELCNLAELYPSHHNSYPDFELSLFYAYLYTKIVTLKQTHWEQTNQIITKNRRIGTGQSGIMNAFKKHGREIMLQWSDNGYKYLKQLDKQYSKLWQIPESIKLTTIKPSGSLSLMAGVSAGIHYSESEWYIRRVRFDSDSILLKQLQDCGYKTEPDKMTSNTYVVEFPIHEHDFWKSKLQVSIEEQLQNVIDYQRVWADNQISYTMTFKPEEIERILDIVKKAEKSTKCLSLLPLNTHGYIQAPYEAITKEQYDAMIQKIHIPKSLQFHESGSGENYCSGGFCQSNG